MAPFVAVSILASLFASAAAISNVQAPSTPAANKKVTVSWSSDSSDSSPVTLALFSVDSPDVTYPGGLALANNVNPKDNSATIVWPQTEPGKYKLAFLDPSNLSKELASSSSFSVSGQAAPAALAASSSGSASATAPPPASSLKSSLSAAASSLSAGLSSNLASLSSAGASASSALVSASQASVSASQSSASASASGTAGAALPVRIGVPVAGLVTVLAGLLVGAAVL